MLNNCYHVAVCVVPFNFICSMTIFRKSFILDSPHPLNLSRGSENASNLTKRYLGNVSGRTGRQTDRKVDRRPTPKQYPSDFIGGKPIQSRGQSVMFKNTTQCFRWGNPSISGQALYNDSAPQLGSILCRYDTCPTQYAPDLRGGILCMQGKQYAPRESILCMEHFVALHVTSWWKSLVYVLFN